jgi:hypothetical protein
MITMTLPDHPAPMYISAQQPAIPTKLVKDTVYMSSRMARQLLGNVVTEDPEDAAK